MLIGAIAVGAVFANDGPPSATAQPAPTSQASTDESLTSDEYLKLGIPAQDREWTGDDVARAAKALTELAKTSIQKLPRLESKRSGKLFARLVSPDNLEGLGNRELALSVRLQAGLAYYQANLLLLRCYETASLKDRSFDSEVTELACAALRSIVVVIDLVDELLPTLDKSAPDYPNRIKGVEQMRRGLASIVTGFFHALTEGHALGNKLKLIRGMTETYPKFVPKLLTDSRKEVMLLLDQMDANPELKVLQPSLGELRTKVKAAVGAVDPMFINDGPPSATTQPTPTSQASTDESLTSDDYLKLGIPAQDRVWTGDDAARAAKVLTELAKTSIQKLPRFESERSGKLFARLISPKNLEIYGNRELPLSMRYKAGLTYYLANDSLFKCYGFASRKDRSFNPEVIELACALLRSIVVAIDLEDELLLTFDKSAPDYPNRMKRADRIKRDLAGVVTSYFQSLAKEHALGNKLKLILSMTETYPKIVPKLLTDSRKEVMLLLDQMDANPELKALQPLLGELRTRVKAAVEAIKEP